MKLSEKINRLNKIEEILSKIEKKGLTDALINRIVSLFDGGFSVGMNIAYKEKLLQEKEKLLKDLKIGCGIARLVKAPRGTQLHCKGWHQEAALRMLCNNLDPDNGETRMN